MALNPRLDIGRDPDEALRAELADLRRRIRVLERGKRVYSGDGAPSADLPDGAFWVRKDTTPKRLYVMVNNTWRYVELT